MTPSDLPTYMREILDSTMRENCDELCGWPQCECPPAIEDINDAMHRAYNLDRDEGSSLREAKKDVVERVARALCVEAYHGSPTAPDDVVERFGGGFVPYWMLFVSPARAAIEAMGVYKVQELIITANRLDGYIEFRNRAGDTNVHQIEDIPEKLRVIVRDALLSPAQRTSLPLPDRERTEGRDDLVKRLRDESLWRDNTVSALMREAAEMLSIPDIVDKREDRSARVEDDVERVALELLRATCEHFGDPCPATPDLTLTRVLACAAIKAYLGVPSGDLTPQTIPPDSSLVTDAEVDAGCHALRRELLKIDVVNAGDYQSLDEPLDDRERQLMRAAVEAARQAGLSCQSPGGSSDVQAPSP